MSTSRISCSSSFVIGSPSALSLFMRSKHWLANSSRLSSVARSLLLSTKFFSQLHSFVLRSYIFKIRLTNFTCGCCTITTYHLLQVFTVEKYLLYSLGGFCPAFTYTAQRYICGDVGIKPSFHY